MACRKTPHVQPVLIIVGLGGRTECSCPATRFETLLISRSTNPF
jgi:hypothetical protein